MKAGDLRSRATFREDRRVPDGGGGHASSYVDVLTVSGHFLPERGRERIQAGRVESGLAAVLRVRSTANTRKITETHRVLVGGRVFDIRSIANPDQRNDMLEMSLEQVRG